MQMARFATGSGEPGGDCAVAPERIGELRVALFSGNYNYTRDGANQALNRLVGDLLDVGASVRIYSPTTATPAFPPTGDLVSVPSAPLPGRPEYRVALTLPQHVRRDVEAFRPTVVHLSAPDLLGLKAQKLGRRLGVPVVSSLHTLFETYLAYYGLDWLRPSVEGYLRRFYSGCDSVLAPNGPTAERLKSQCPQTRVRIWSRGVDRRQFSPERRSRAWREAAGLAEDEVAVLFLGRLVMEKGLDVFAQTIESLRGRVRVRAVVVGDGPAAAWLRKRLPDAIFTGMLVQPELGEAVSSADIFFNPSRTETFGNVTLESMAAGLAVVCPDVGSSRELITSGENGLLAASHDAEAYAEALLQLVTNPELRARLAAGARRTSERFDWRACSMSVVSAYVEAGGLPHIARPAPQGA
jgi:glycosyltransferase involved in cell wall biosynthesis